MFRIILIINRRTISHFGACCANENHRGDKLPECRHRSVMLARDIPAKRIPKLTAVRGGDVSSPQRGCDALVANSLTSGKPASQPATRRRRHFLRRGRRRYSLVGIGVGSGQRRPATPKRRDPAPGRGILVTLAATDFESPARAVSSRRPRAPFF